MLHLYQLFLEFVWCFSAGQEVYQGLYSWSNVNKAAEVIRVNKEER